MGSCVSVDTVAAAADPAVQTAKVITLSGSLREYSSHLTAADVLADDGGAYCFLCSSDKLFCGDYIPPLDPEEPLWPGQLYFVLPGAKFRYPLLGTDMKELVVKASSALVVASERGGAKREKKVKVMPVLEVDGGQPAAGDVDDVRKCDDKGSCRRQRPVMVHRRMKRSGSVSVGFRRRCSSGARLSTILEVVE